MSRYRFILLTALLAVLLPGCIKNDIPYPHIPQLILSLVPDGQERATEIDSTNYIAVVYLNEDVDIETVTFSNFTYTEGAECSVNLLEGEYNLARSLSVTLHRYYDYEWIISARQTIERYVEVEGQIGETDINTDTQVVTVKVPETADLRHLTLTRIKLGPADITTMDPDVKPGPIDLSSPLKVYVTYHGRTYLWTIKAEKTELLVSTTSADAWSQVIWVYGQGQAERTNGFQYREASSSTWIDVPAEYVTTSQGSFSCYIPHLTPLTDYVVRAVSGSDYGNEIRVTTQATADIPDGDFDQWWLNGKIWCPWDEGGTPYWDTGNTGAATLGQSNVVPSDYTPDGKGKSAELNTKFVGIAGIGKLAAGSIYTGKFAKVDGTNGILDFGRPWNLRPTKLRGYFSYKTAPINYASTEYKYLMDRPDSCHIYVALTDWTAPFEIRTNPKTRNLFDKNSPSVIAYGELICGHDTDGYQAFEIKLDYRSTSRVPTYLQITNAASKYGDFFTGGAGAVLYVDQYSFDYDY